MLLTRQSTSRTTIITLACCLAIIAPALSTDAADTDGSIGPDIVTFDVYEPIFWGTEGAVAAYSVGTESCNRGDEPADWISGTNEHPVISQNLYRLKDGRFEQIGMSWLKHGFLSLNDDECDTCIDPPNGGAQLGVGCSDPYWASLNGDQYRLGPRFEVNAFTGVFVYPHTRPPEPYTTIGGRLQVATADIDPAANAGARFFAEGQYVTADEAAAGNSENSASYREQAISSNLQMSDIGSTYESVPAIYAWQAADPAVDINEVRVPNEGLFITAAVVRDNGNGTWRYEYAVFNLNSHRSARAFTVPILPDAQITNTGFHDVDYHTGEPFDGTDWTVTVDNPGGTVTWATDTFATNENANALRWGTMYNFWFDADKEPTPDSATIELFRDGTPSSIQTLVSAPSVDSLIFADGFESGNTNAWN